MATDKASFIGRHPNRVCAWLRGKNYPADGIIITGAKVQKDVPLTAEVLLLEKQGEIIRVEDEKTATDLTQVKGIARATAEKLSDLGCIHCKTSPTCPAATTTPPCWHLSAKTS